MGIIQRAFKESKDLSWPPPMSSLEVTDQVMPAPLKQFLSLVMSAIPTAASDQTERVVFSIGQDICRAVTNGEWKLLKHILLCIILHLYRSRQLVTLLNRLGQWKLSVLYWLKDRCCCCSRSNNICAYSTNREITREHNFPFWMGQLQSASDWTSW